MAIEFVSQSTAAPGGGGTTVVINAPATIAEGNVLVASIRAASAGTQITTTAPDGWVEISQLATATLSSSMWRKVATGSEPGTYTFTYSAAASGRAGGITQWFGVDTTTPIDVAASQNSDTSATATATGITTVTDGTMLLAHYATGGNVTFTAPSGMTEQWIAGRGSLFTGGQATAGASGDKDAALSASSFYIAILAALRPVTGVAAPTVTPDTADAITLGGTPALSFTGTSDGADPIRYQIQISSSNTFDGTLTLVDSVSGSGSNLHPNPTGTTAWTGEYQVDDRFGQSFNGAGGAKFLVRAEAFIEPDTATDGDSVARIYNHAGTYGSTGTPANPAAPTDTPTPGWLAESDPVYFDTGSTQQWYAFDFRGLQRVMLASATNYFLIFDWWANSTAYANTIVFGGDAGLGHDGNAYIDGDSANNGIRSDFDLLFKIWESEILLNKLSGTDAGFSGTPDNVDPYASGQQVTYTVQAVDELISGVTYYWRVRGIDPDGSNVWSDWTATRSFTVADVLHASKGTFLIQTTETTLTYEPLTSFTLTAEVGAVSLSGVDANLSGGFAIQSDANSFDVSGISANLLLGRSLQNDVGSFDIAGNASQIIASRYIQAQNGALLIEALDAVTMAFFVISLETGSVSLSGTESALASGRLVAAEQTGYSVSGLAASLTHQQVGSYTIVVESASYSVSQENTGLLKESLLAASAESYSVSGQNVGLVASRNISIVVGAYNVTASDVSLSHETAGSYTLLASANSIVLGTTQTNLLASRIIGPDFGSFAVDGIDSSLALARGILADIAEYSVQEVNAETLFGRVVLASTDSMAIGGQDTILSRGFIVLSEQGGYVLSGDAVAFIVAWRIPGETGQYVSAGSNTFMFWSGLEVQTPSTRIYTVSKEIRTIYVEPESRVIEVERENRIIYID